MVGRNEMTKIRGNSSATQDEQPEGANPFMRIELFPGFVPSQETIDYVNARFGSCPIHARLEKLRQKRQVENVPKNEVE
jgi:hypothetical protein